MSAAAGLRPMQTAAYAFMGLPLAFVALPIYVHLPGLYAGFGLPLATIGAVLLAARLQDALVDPLIGAWSDGIGRRRALLLGLPPLAAGFAGLVAPPFAPGAVWLLAMLCLVHLGYSLASINHQAWGAELVDSPLARTRLVAVREGCALIGVLLAAVLPSLLAAEPSVGLARLAWLLALWLAVAALALWRLPESRQIRTASLDGLGKAWRSRRFRLLLAVFAPSGIAAALPATLVSFFVADVLRAGALTGVFLALYFISAAAGLPLWVSLARRWGKLRAWGACMLLVILVFACAGLLGPGDSLAFGLICVLSGIALGAELALPASLLADLVEREGGHAGAFFGCWNLVAKLNLAFAAGLALPLLGWLGYTPGGGGALAMLSLVYAGLPVLLKLFSFALLWRLHREIES